jgi:hypothetical protein
VAGSLFSCSYICITIGKITFIPVPEIFFENPETAIFSGARWNLHWEKNWGFSK